MGWQGDGHLVLTGRALISQVDMEMERRALEEGGYDSDLDREEAVMQEMEPRGPPPPPPDANLVGRDGRPGGTIRGGELGRRRMA